MTESILTAWWSAGVRRIVVKAGGDDGSLYTDPQHGTTVGIAHALGFTVDRYWFNGRTNPISEQASYYWGVVGPTIQDDETLWLDTENEGSVASWTLSETQSMTDALPHRTGVYRSLAYLDTSWSTYTGPLWVAYWTGNTSNPPTSPKPWELWQYTDKGTLPGYPGAIDLSINA